MKNKTINNLLSGIILSYGFYAFFILLEIFYFLALLHCRDHEGLIFSMVHVGYFIVEMIICLVLTYVFIRLKDKKEIDNTYLTTAILATLSRAIIIYYLYFFTNPNAEVQVPYIYKIAYLISKPVRNLFTFSQVILGIILSIALFRNSRKIE